MGTNPGSDCDQLSKQMSAAKVSTNGTSNHVSFVSNSNGANGKENGKPQSNVSPLRRSASAPIRSGDDGHEKQKKLDFASDCTFPEATECNKNVGSWSRIDGSMFSVRCGANYQKNKLKAPSLPSLYEVVAVRCFKSNDRTRRIAETLPLPIKEAYPQKQSQGGSEAEPDVRIGQISNPAIPEILLVHFALPFEEPNMFRSKNQAKGGEVVFYLRPSKRFVDEINGDSPMTPATNLFAKWCQTCDKDFDMRSKFKCMAMVDDLDKLNLGWVTPYNGKPVLITESGSARRGMQSGVRYLEMTANVHKWGFLAKKSFVSLIPRYKDMKINIGFTIEATQDYEMPECMLGTVCMNNMDDKSLIEIPEELQVFADDDGTSSSSSSPRKSLLGSMKKK